VHIHNNSIAGDSRDSSGANDSRDNNGANDSRDSSIAEDTSGIKADNNMLTNNTTTTNNTNTPNITARIEKDTFKCYSIKEKYNALLETPANLFHFYASSSSVLNQTKAKTIHKAGCPLTQPIFSPEEMDRRLIYMIKKADTMNNKEVTSYTLWIINLISSSLPLLTAFFLRHFGLLLTLKDQGLIGSFIKIFCSRLNKAINGALLCCDCGYSSYEEVEELIALLLKYDLASQRDVDFYYAFKAEKEGVVMLSGLNLSSDDSKERLDSDYHL
jgi:Sec7-like guanine-nucleotide exchange factor